MITLNQDGSNNYGLFHKTNDGVLHILSGLPTDLGADWSDWMTNADVAGFYAHPDTYVAVGGGNIGVAHYNPETGF